MVDKIEDSKPGMDNLSDEDLQIVEFITSNQIQQRAESDKILEQKVKEKYGEKGLNILALLTEDVELSSEDNTPCAGCGDDSAEYTGLMENKIEDMIRADEELDMIADKCLENEKSFKKDDVLFTISEFKQIEKDKIDTDLYVRVCERIIEKGVEQGWLVDELFQ